MKNLVFIAIILIACNNDKKKSQNTSVKVIEKSSTVKVPIDKEIQTEADEIQTEKEILTLLSQKIFSAIQNKDFETIKKYVAAKNFDFFWWKIKTDSLEKYNFSLFPEVEMEQCPSCGDAHYYTAKGYLNEYFVNDSVYYKIDSSQLIFHSNLDWMPNTEDSMPKKDEMGEPIYAEYLYYGSLNKKIRTKLDFEYRMVSLLEKNPIYSKTQIRNPILLFKKAEDKYNLIGIYDFRAEYYDGY
tara:strand:+ start:23 stop:748 length:726 start_codon:yes stop_codon:yes gene_type:complete